MSTRSRILLPIAALAVAGLTVTAGPAQASGGGDTAVRKSGTCSSASTWKLKAKPDNSLLQIEFEVDSNRVGQTWNVRITDNGTRIFAGTRTTVAPSGSFTVSIRRPNLAGTDTIVARATNPATGETCRGSVTL